MRRLKERFSTGRIPTDNMSRLSTPSTFDTPQRSDNADSKNEKESKINIETAVDDSEEKKKDELKNVSLDTFLAKHTSEDNESFHDLMEEQREEFERTHKWMFKDDEQLSIENKNAQIALPSIEDQCASTNIKSLESKPLDGWTYKNVNAVFYNPEGVVLTDAEKVELAKKQRSINIENTRFKTNPWKMSEQQKGTLVAARKEHELGKVGADGKDLVDSKATPSVNGYKLLRLGMISHKKSVITIFGHKHKIKNFIKKFNPKLDHIFVISQTVNKVVRGVAIFVGEFCADK